MDLCYWEIVHKTVGLQLFSAARHIYEKAGFRLVEQEDHHSFGHDLVGETWELEL